MSWTIVMLFELRLQRFEETTLSYPAIHASPRDPFTLLSIIILFWKHNQAPGVQ